MISAILTIAAGVFLAAVAFSILLLIISVLLVIADIWGVKFDD